MTERIEQHNENLKNQDVDQYCEFCNGDMKYHKPLCPPYDLDEHYVTERRGEMTTKCNSCNGLIPAHYKIYSEGVFNVCESCVIEEGVDNVFERLKDEN